MIVTTVRPDGSTRSVWRDDEVGELVLNGTACIDVHTADGQWVLGLDLRAVTAATALTRHGDRVSVRITRDRPLEL